MHEITYGKHAIVSAAVHESIVWAGCYAHPHRFICCVVHEVEIGAGRRAVSIGVLGEQSIGADAHTLAVGGGVVGVRGGGSRACCITSHLTKCAFPIDVVVVGVPACSPGACPHTGLRLVVGVEAWSRRTDLHTAVSGGIGIIEVGRCPRTYLNRSIEYLARTCC